MRGPTRIVAFKQPRIDASTSTAVIVPPAAPNRARAAASPTRTS